MDDLETLCNWNTKVILDALVIRCSRTRTLLWLGRACSGDRESGRVVSAGRLRLFDVPVL